MSCWRSSERRLGAATAFVVCCVLASTAHAQSSVGEQWLTAGLSVTPGFFWDPTAAAVDLDRASVTGGLRARLGFQHRVASHVTMAAEAELGQGWHSANRAAPDGFASSNHHFQWQAGLVGRFLTRDDGSGPAAGLGLHMFRASLPEAPLQALGGDVRAGWFFWRKKNFVLAELGYAFPFISGLDLPFDFTDEAPDPVPKTWTLHRFVFGFSYGF